MPDAPTYTDLLPQTAAIDTAAPEPAPRMDWKQVPAKMAVYLLTDDTNQPLLLATVGNLRAALERRLAAPPPDIKTRRINYGKIACHVHYRVVHSAFAANLWYYRAATELYPQTYSAMISWQPAWWISVDPTAAFPRFGRTQNLTDPALHYRGPIPDKTSAGKLIEMLEDVFDLCRYYNILVQAPRGKACAYKEMGKCPAPCDGTVSMEHYRGQIAAALAILQPADFIGRAAPTGVTVLPGTAPSCPSSPPTAPAPHELPALRLSPGAAWRQSMEMQMRSAAAALEFERAARIKAKLERAALLAQPPYRFLGALAQCSFLALQPGQGRPYVEPYFIHGGTIEAAPAVHKKALPAATAEWFTRCAQLRDQPVQPPLSPQHTRHIGLLVHHLLRGPDDAGLYLPLHTIADSQTILTAAQTLLARRRKPKPVPDQSSEAVPQENGTPMDHNPL